MRVLFIGTNDLSGKSGGSMCSKRNYEVLKSIFGQENVAHRLLRAETRRGLIGKLRYYLAVIFRKSAYYPVRFSKAQLRNVDVLYIDNAYAAGCIHEAKRKGFRGKIIVFFHNCEYDFRLMGFEQGARWKYLLQRRVVMHNERLGLLYSDACLFLTRRDLNREKDIYGIVPNVHAVCPITMSDTFRQTPSDIIRTPHAKPLYTFIGSYFGPNIHAMQWFVTKVLPYVDITLRIVGKDMDRLRTDMDCSGVEIYSNVEDVEPFVLESDYMLFPLFEGSGMKVKTCEALMYGKNIVGTPEAFTGYDIDDLNQVGACCSDEKQFISAINAMQMPPYNPYSRQIFLSKYDDSVAVQIMRQLLKQVC